MIHYTDYRSDQRHEEKRKPDDADEEKDDEASHAILDNLLFLLPLRLWITLQKLKTFVTPFCQLTRTV